MECHQVDDLFEIWIYLNDLIWNELVELRQSRDVEQALHQHTSESVDLALDTRVSFRGGRGGAFAPP